MKCHRALSILFATLLFAGCQSGEEPGAPEGPQAAGGSETSTASQGTIGVSVLTLNNPFFKIIGDTITREAKKHGYETIVVSGDNDAARQHKQVQDFIVRKCAAIVLCPCDSQAVGASIKAANEAGIPVFTTDIGTTDLDAKVTTHIATDNLGGGRHAGEAMIEALGTAGGEVLLIGYKDVESCQLREKGFREVLAAHNEKAANKIEIVADLPGQGERDRGFKAAEDALQAHPNLRGIFAINDPSALGARAALEKAGKADRIQIIGFDGQDEGKRAIRDGKIYADPVQFPDRMGIETVQAIVQLSNGIQPPKEILIPTEIYRQADGQKDKTLGP